MENYIAFENVERKFGVLACIAAAIYLPYLSYAWILTTLDSTTMAIVKLSSSSLSSYSIASINLSVRQCLFIVYCCCRCYYHFVLHFTASHRYRHPEKRILTEKILRHDCSRIMNEKLWLLLLALCERSDIRFIVSHNRDIESEMFAALRRHMKRKSPQVECADRIIIAQNTQWNWSKDKIKSGKAYCEGHLYTTPTNRQHKFLVSRAFCRLDFSLSM